MVISEVGPNERTRAIREILLWLVDRFDLAPILYTKVIHIQPMVIPHSHPVLTLNTQNVEDPEKVLASFVHEQMHWFLETKGEAERAAVERFRKIYPEVPFEGAAESSVSTYRHLAVNWLELQLLKHYLGPERGYQIVRSIADDDGVHPWIYHAVLESEAPIGEIMREQGLIPPNLIMN